MDAIRELIHCPKIISRCIPIDVEGLKHLKDVVRHLPRLTDVRVRLGLIVTLADIEEVLNEVLKIIWIRDYPPRSVSLFVCLF